MKKTILLLALAALALPASADLVGFYAFDRANPLEAVIGSPAKEGVMSSNNTQPALSDSIFTISLVTGSSFVVSAVFVVSGAF